MEACLNLLNKPEVFIPTAALLALVLLVWVQLHVHGKGPRSVNWVCGVAWAYLAILSALTAVALFICNPTSTCAKGFLILAFFMTGMNIAFLFGQNIVRLFGDLSEKSWKRSLFGKCGKNKCWIFFWVFLLIGLGLISFSPSLLGVRFCWSLQFIIGLKLVEAAVLAAIVVVWWKHIWPKLKDICSKCCLCTCLRRKWRKVRSKCKKCWRKWRERRNERRRAQRH